MISHNSKIFIVSVDMGHRVEEGVKMEAVEYRAVIRFLFLKGRTPKETFGEMKETYGEDAPSYDVVKHWHRQFKCDRASVDTSRLTPVDN